MHQKQELEDMAFFINCQKSFAPTICEESLIKEFQYV
jgi:hypothetical protein